MTARIWGVGLLLALFLCACSTTSQVNTTPQERPRAAEPADKQAVKKASKPARTETIAAGTRSSEPATGSAAGIGPGFSGSDPGLKQPSDCPPGMDPREWEALKANSKAQNGNSETEEIEDEILDLLKLAQAYRDKGDMDNALRTLDRAYSMMLDEEDTSTIVRQKDDLRLIIARKILEIYTGRRTAAPGRLSEIPLIMNPDVEKEIRSFQTVERGFFERSYERSGYYLPLIKQQLRQAGLPEELAWLPLVESGFQVTALSKARALGLWQFIPSTGYKYGLNRDIFIDDRMSVEKSTQGAIAYLTDLHGLFGDWLTALAAYNCGEGRVLKVIARQQINYLDHFWDLYRELPYETARYVPRFLATLHIVRNPKKYGMDLPEPFAKPVPFETVKTTKPMRLFDIACQIGVSTDTLVMLNPDLKHQMTPDRGYDLKLPQGLGQQYALVADQIKESKPPTPPEREKKVKVVKYKVKPGETASSVARKYGMTAKSLLAYNGLKSESQLKAGTVVKIPVKSREKTTQVAVKGKKGKKAAAEPEPVFVKYTVKKGETLTQIAKRYNTTPAEIKKANQLTTLNVKSGQVLKIKNPKSES